MPDALKTSAIVLLTGLALAQVIQRGVRDEVSSDTSPPVEGLAESWELLGAPAQGAVVLAFHPECEHSVAISRDWAQWIGALSDDGTEVIVLTRADPELAEIHRARVGWAIPVESVEQGSPLAGMAGRTPWIYVLNRDGELVFQGHGNRWREATEAIESIRGRPE